MKLMLPAVLALALAASPAAAQMNHQMSHDPDKNVEGGGLPAGWQARLDKADAKVEQVKFAAMGGGFHVVTGPSGVFYEPGKTASGAYTVQGTFSQLKPSAHPEAYGLIIGGSDLAGPNQQYTYFLIRQDGKFLIKRRLGAETRNVMDWTDSPAIKKGEGTQQNVLSIAVTADAVKFLVNGTEVGTAKPAQVDTRGVYGLRVNHNLEVHVEGLASR